jgi:hypothetical protein
VAQSKTILADVDGWTPLIDEMVQMYGVIGASIFGRIWRYCQMKDGVCSVSLSRIGDDLDLDKATVMRYAARLVQDGYIEDTTPDIGNKPHTYRDTGKASLGVSVKAKSSYRGVAQDNVAENNVAQDNASVAESNTGVAQDNAHIRNIRNNKETPEETTQNGAQKRASVYVHCKHCNGKIRVAVDSNNRGSPVAPCVKCGVDVLTEQEIAMDEPNIKADAGKCKGYYEHLFFERFGKRPHVTKGKDFGILEDLVGQYGKKTVQDFIDKFLRLTDEKVVDAGYPIAWLPNRINGFIVNGNGGSQLPPKAQKTQSNLQTFRTRRTGT